MSDFLFREPISLNLLPCSQSLTMKIQGHLQDYPLSELIEILANRGESGCLRIQFDPQPAFFYFKSGQLVEARMSHLKGFAAIHLAFSRAKAPFDFDNCIIPPELSINDENERLLLTNVLGLKLGGESEGSLFEVVPRPIATARSEDVIQQPVTEPPVPPTTKRLTDSGIGSAAFNILKKQLVESSETNEVPAAPIAPSLHEDAAGSSRASVSPRPVRNSAKRAAVSPASSYLPRQKLFRTAAAILVFAVPAVVGLTVRLGKRSAATPVAAATEETTARTNSHSLPATVSKVDENKLPPTTPVQSSISPTTQVKREVYPAVLSTPALDKTTRPVTKDSPSDEPRVISEAEPSQESKQSPSPVPQESNSETKSRSVVVVVRIEEGRVAEAWVKNSHPGLEAFEATAIRQARQRRYPKDTSRTESVAVNVTVNR